MLRGDPKKGSRIGYFPYSRIWGSHRDRCSVQSFSFKVCFGLCLNHKRRRRNFKVQRSNVVLAIQKFLLIFANELVLSEMGENLFLWLSSFLSSLVTRWWDLPSSILERSCLHSKVDINLIDPSETENSMLESSRREEIQRYCQEKFLSIAISRGMSFSRKRWCRARGAKLVTCLARTAQLSHLLVKILACLSLSRVLLLQRIKTLHSLILPQRFFFALDLCNNLLLRRKMWLEGIAREKFRIRIRVLD